LIQAVSWQSDPNAGDELPPTNKRKVKAISNGFMSVTINVVCEEFFAPSANCG
jgi:hypothetical protein